MANDTLMSIGDVANAMTVDAACAAVLAAAGVAKALDDIRLDAARTLSEQRTLAEIPSPPFGEEKRAAYFRDRLHQLGLVDAAIDGEGNVVALRRGAGGGPRLIVSAHLDTVFPAGTPIAVTERDGRLYAPGIGDDARGLAAVLAVVKAMNENGLATVGDILFVGTVGEEELGNLRGVKALFREHHDIDGFISVDGLQVGRIINEAIGSLRYEITFKGPGGHSFQAYGLPSAIHAMGRAIAKIADIVPPAEPKTTFTVGTVTGGTSVNAIAGEARMRVDLRSVSMEELRRLEATVRDFARAAAAEENQRWGQERLNQRISVNATVIGDRPAGATPRDAAIVAVARRMVEAVTGSTSATFAASSTDSNIAMSLGVPAVTIGAGGSGGDAHTLNEWFDPTDAHLGPQNALLTTLALVGIADVCAPVLTRRGGGSPHVTTPRRA
jgi:tripeptide aminopeptidase